MSRSLALLLAVFGLLLFGAAAAKAGGSSNPVGDTHIAGVSQDYSRYVAPLSLCPASAWPNPNSYVARRTMRCLIKYARHKKGVPPVRFSAELRYAATLKLRAQIRCNRLTHTPCGESFLRAFRLSGYTRNADSYVVAENLGFALPGQQTAREVFLDLLESAPHRRNLLDPRFREVGVAYGRIKDIGDHEALDVWVQNFGVLRD